MFIPTTNNKLKVLKVRKYLKCLKLEVLKVKST